MTDSSTALVIGAGPAGLGTAALLQRAGHDTLLLEAGPSVATMWRARYDGFLLNTSRWFSHLPDRKLPKHDGYWPGRETMVDYYEGFAADERLNVRTNTKAQRIERTPDAWQVSTTGGPITARHVVVTTGNYREPVIPDWPGKDDFQGELVHASTFRNADPYKGKDVLVVGTGNTGVDVAVQLADAGCRVRSAVRTPPHLVLRSFAGLPADTILVATRHVPAKVIDAVMRRVRTFQFGDLSHLGLYLPPEGLRTHMDRTSRIPTIAGPFVERVREGRITIVPEVERLDATGVILRGDARIEPDVVIAATGYRRGLEPLVGHLGVLGERGRPTHQAGATHPDAPNLHFLGFTEPYSGPLRELRRLAPRIVDVVTRAEEVPAHA